MNFNYRDLKDRISSCSVCKKYPTIENIIHLHDGRQFLEIGCFNPGCSLKKCIRKETLEEIIEYWNVMMRHINTNSICFVCNSELCLKKDGCFNYYYIECINEKCQLSGPYGMTKEDAVEKWKELSGKIK